MAERSGAVLVTTSAWGRLTSLVYWLGMVEVAFLLAASPGLIGLLMLDATPRNLPLYALCLLPVGPAFAAAMATLQARSSAEELSAFRRYWRTYLRDLRDVLAVWVPALLLATIFATTIAFAGPAGVGDFYLWAAVALLALVGVVTMNALVITALFRFRLRDRVRLALYYVAARPLVTLGILSTFVLAAAISVFATDAVLALLAAPFAAFVVTTTAPIVRDIRVRFVADDTPTPEGAGVRPPQ